MLTHSLTRASINRCIAGGVMPRGDLDKIMALVLARPNCWVLSDEIYSQLT